MGRDGAAMRGFLPPRADPDLPDLSSGGRRADSQGMKLLLPILAVLLCSGCFVLDEIEQGQAIMKAHDGKPDDAEESEGPADAKSPPKTPRERLADSRPNRKPPKQHRRHRSSKKSSSISSRGLKRLLPAL